MTKRETSKMIMTCKKRPTEDGRVFSFKKGSASTLAKFEDILEKHVQDYFAESFDHYGYSELEGPFSRGPDFYAVNNGLRVPVEVETSSGHYLKHKHDESSSFDGAHLLCLYLNKHHEDTLSRLPETITVIDEGHFHEWWDNRNLNEYFNIAIELLYAYFYSLYVSACSDRERSDSHCFGCNQCVYGNDNTANTIREIAIDYLSEGGFGVIHPSQWPSHFLSLEPNELHEFYAPRIMRAIFSELA